MKVITKKYLLSALLFCISIGKGINSDINPYKSIFETNSYENYFSNINNTDQCYQKLHQLEENNGNIYDKEYQKLFQQVYLGNDFNKRLKKFNSSANALRNKYGESDNKLIDACHKRNMELIDANYKRSMESMNADHKRRMKLLNMKYNNTNYNNNLNKYTEDLYDGYNSDDKITNLYNSNQNKYSLDDLDDIYSEIDTDYKSIDSDTSFNINTNFNVDPSFNTYSANYSSKKTSKNKKRNKKRKQKNNDYNVLNKYEQPDVYLK